MDATSQAGVARAQYQALHEGRPADRVYYREAPRRPRRLEILGRITEIQYLKQIPDETPHYHHPFDPDAAPLFGRDERGRLWILAGRYVVTNRGIEDKSVSQIKGERLPKVPERLVTLGSLEWFAYKRDTSAGTEVGVYEFPAGARPTLAHNQAGELYALGEKYALVKATGEHEIMKRRRNPTETKASLAKRVVLSTIVVSAVGAASALLIDKAMERVNLNPYAKAGAKAGIGLGGSIIMALVGAPAPVTAGFGIGCVLDGAKDAWYEWRARQAAGSTTAPAATTPAPATAPAQGAFLPSGGVPGAFGVASAQSCGVAR